ncbi:MAG TPA: ferrous iron transporter B [Candidatus Eisenbacteria bacterium]|nr:ferrous iron transporter B [Candidatus Eisenbacteria bacterium]
MSLRAACHAGCHHNSNDCGTQRDSTEKFRTVALIGPPNSGKSTLFNRLTALRQKVANYPGVTVEHRTGALAGNSRNKITLVDLPGVYDLTAYSEDERVAAQVLHGEMPGVSRPDAVLIVVDVTNMERHLSIVPDVLRTGLPVLLILNMADLLEKRGGRVNLVKLAGQVGVPVALVSAASNTGIEAINEFLHAKQSGNGKHVLPVLQGPAACQRWARNLTRASEYRPPLPAKWTRRMDGLLLHPVWGPLIFLLVLVALFQAVFTIGQPLSDGLQSVLDKLGEMLFAWMGVGFAKSILFDGVWKGLGSILVFLPQILVLFLFITVLEDSGYLARAALIADRTMQRVGLNGKSFVPLLSAYACAVPAIMAARTIENRRDRLATILIAPFMTCSARLPIYTLVIAAFIPDRALLGPLLGYRGAAMLGMYVLGFLAALLTAGVLKSSILKSCSMPFVMELPEYRWPTLRSMFIRSGERAWIFTKNAGSVILIVATILALLANLPLVGGVQPGLQHSFIGRLGHVIEPVIQPLGFNWRVGIGLITSVFAREVIVGTFGTLYGADAASRDLTLQSALQHDLAPGGAAALLVFFAFALQCTSTLAVVKRETNSWRWPVFQFSYMAALAYTGAFFANFLISRIWL